MRSAIVPTNIICILHLLCCSIAASESIPCLVPHWRSSIAVTPNGRQAEAIQPSFGLLSLLSPSSVTANMISSRSPYNPANMTADIDSEKGEANNTTSAIEEKTSPIVDTNLVGNILKFSILSLI